MARRRRCLRGGQGLLHQFFIIPPGAQTLNAADLFATLEENDGGQHLDLKSLTEWFGADGVGIAFGDQEAVFVILRQQGDGGAQLQAGATPRRSEINQDGFVGLVHRG